MECANPLGREGPLGRHKAVCYHLCYHWHPVGHCIHPVPAYALRARAPQQLVVALLSYALLVVLVGAADANLRIDCRARRSEDPKDKAGALTSRASASATIGCIQQGSYAIIWKEESSK